MSHFILSGVWHEDLLPLPLLDLKQVRNITVANKEATIQYHFNRQGQLDSLTGSTELAPDPTGKVLYKDGIPVAACCSRDTSRFSYAGDTLIVLHRGMCYAMY